MMVFRLALLFLLCVSASAGEWPGRSFSEVRGYYYNAASEHGRRVIDANGKLDSTVVQRGGVLLNADQSARLLALIRRGAGVQPVTSCYVPHHAFLFTNAWGTRVGVFEFCLECLKATPTPNTAGPFYDYVTLAELLHEIGLPIGPKFRTPADYRKFHTRTMRAAR